jgi:Fe2+ transport system protein B
MENSNLGYHKGNDITCIWIKILIFNKDSKTIVFILLNKIIFNMAINNSNRDDYKREIIKRVSNNNEMDKSTTSEKVNLNEKDTKESEADQKVESVKENINGKISEADQKVESVKENINGKISKLVEQTKKDHKEKELFNFKPILFSLFALIGFIIIVYAIFTAAVGQPLASVADTVFVAALIGCFTLVSTFIGRISFNR